MEGPKLVRRSFMLSDDEMGELRTSTLGPSAPTMDFELSDEYVEGWDSARAAMNGWFLQRFSGVKEPSAYTVTSCEIAPGDWYKNNLAVYLDEQMDKGMELVTFSRFGPTTHTFVFKRL